MTGSQTPAPHINIPSHEYGGQGQSLIFLHANGYPPDCYRALLARLAENYRVTAMLQRPLWVESDPADLDDWRPLADDLLHFLKARPQKSFIGVGHSMGGNALLRAALREPQRFKALVLIDPVLFPPYLSLLWRLIRGLGWGHHLHPLIATARKRRQQFDDLERVYQGYRRKSIFRYMDDQALRDYVQGITCQIPDGSYELCYQAEWEAHIYFASVWQDLEIWRQLPTLRVPTYILRGSETDTFWSRTGRLVKRKQPEIRIEALERATHLLPLEHPQRVAERTHAFLEEVI